MKFLVNIHSNGIEVVNQLRDFLRSRYKEGDSVIVNFVEPGMKYFEDNRWKTFVDLIEENLDKRMSYYGCQYINKSTKLPHWFLNNMFHCGHEPGPLGCCLGGRAGRGYPCFGAHRGQR